VDADGCAGRACDYFFKRFNRRGWNDETTIIRRASQRARDKEDCHDEGSHFERAPF
jgi:hypothetical protein